MIDDTLHLGPEELDLWLEGRLPKSRMSHLETCEVCRTALEETREVVFHLSRLPEASPSPRFADRVMSQITIRPQAEHLTGDDLDRWVLGTLPTAREAHLRRCPQCQALADQERVLVMRLEALPLFDTRAGFANRIMHEIDLPVTSLPRAWRHWRMRASREPTTVGITAAVAMMLGGSIAASAAWAAGHLELITGADSWLLTQAQQWWWQAPGIVIAVLERQPWYGAVRAALTPGRVAMLTGTLVLLYAGGVVFLRRLLALPTSDTARAAS